MSDLTKPLVIDLESYRAEARQHRNTYHLCLREILDLFENRSDMTAVSIDFVQRVSALCFSAAMAAVRFNQAARVIAALEKANNA